MLTNWSALCYMKAGSCSVQGCRLEDGSQGGVSPLLTQPVTSLSGSPRESKITQKEVSTGFFQHQGRGNSSVMKSFCGHTIARLHKETHKIQHLVLCPHWQLLRMTLWPTQSGQVEITGIVESNDINRAANLAKPGVRLLELLCLRFLYLQNKVKSTFYIQGKDG